MKPMTLKDVRVYDSGEKFIDRYTAVYMNLVERADEGTYSAVGMNSVPFSPSGFGQHITAKPGRHLGRRIKFEELPADCQKLILQDIADVNASDDRPMGL